MVVVKVGVDSKSCADVPSNFRLLYFYANGHVNGYLSVYSCIPRR
jgi:hypothetical protein